MCRFETFKCSTNFCSAVQECTVQMQDCANYRAISAEGSSMAVPPQYSVCNCMPWLFGHTFWARPGSKVMYVEEIQLHVGPMPETRTFSNVKNMSQALKQQEEEKLRLWGSHSQTGEMPEPEVLPNQRSLDYQRPCPDLLWSRPWKEGNWSKDVLKSPPTNRNALKRSPEQWSFLEQNQLCFLLFWCKTACALILLVNDLNHLTVSDPVFLI